MKQAARSGKQNIIEGSKAAAKFLLDQQLKGLEKAFLKEGGFRERMTHPRLLAREQHRKNRQ